jgi:2,5-diketo-D-gluconate reductase A
MADVPTLSLSAGTSTVEIPQLGFGVWQVPDDEATPSVLTALEAGYRNIDTAAMYKNEAGVGRALAQSAVPREDVFVATKVWNGDHGAGATKAAFDASLDRLGIDVLDLYLIHWPAPKQDLYVETFATMLDLREAGRIRAVGVCNFNIDHLQRLQAETGEFPAINQVELHPYLQQRELRDFHAEHGIVTEDWSPLASGGDVLRDDTIRGIADAHGVTPAQAILRWHLQLGSVVIPKSVTPSRIVENFDVFGFELTDAEMDAIAGLDRGQRTGPDPATFG